MKMYCVRMYSDEVDMIVGYASTEEKAKQMIEFMECLDGYEDCYSYEYYLVYIDAIIVNNKKVEF